MRDCRLLNGEIGFDAVICQVLLNDGYRERKRNHLPPKAQRGISISPTGTWLLSRPALAPRHDPRRDLPRCHTT